MSFRDLEQSRPGVSTFLGSAWRWWSHVVEQVHYFSSAGPVSRADGGFACSGRSLNGEKGLRFSLIE